MPAMPRQENAALASLLSSNHAPRSCEAASVQGHLDKLTCQITQLRTRSRPQGLEEQLRLYRAVLSCIRRVPAEVLGEIFVFALPEELLDAPRRAQLVDLQLVCKTWRDAARLEHRLWSGLSFSLSLTQEMAPKDICRWFSRSGNLPKSLHLSIPNHRDCEDQDSPCRLHAPALASLLAEGGPLKHLSLECERSQCARCILSLAVPEAAQPPRAWESLKSVSLEFRTGWNESPDPGNSLLSLWPPNVASVDLILPDKAAAFDFPPFSAYYTSLHLPATFLERLTSLSLVCNWEGLRWLESTLWSCTNVETLTLELNGLNVCSEDQEDQEFLERIRAGILLPRVRTLRLSRANLRGLSSILGILRTPQLAELDIDMSLHNSEDYTFAGPMLPSMVPELINRSNCEGSFRSFRLRNAQVHAEHLADTLRSLPSLTHLTLDDVVVPKSNRQDIFRLLKDDVKPSLPHLEVLELLKVNPKFSHSSLLDFLKSRRPFTMKNRKTLFLGPPDTLRELTVTFAPTTVPKKGQSIDASPVTQALRKCGVSVHIGPQIHVGD